MSDEDEIWADELQPAESASGRLLFRLSAVQGPNLLNRRGLQAIVSSILRRVIRA